MSIHAQTETDARAPSDAALTIDELARRTGMTARNIRAHQSRGLLPPPEVRGRTGYYDERHAERLRLIQRMQADGFNLEAIRRLIGSEQSDPDGGGHEFGALIVHAFEPEEPAVMTERELRRALGPLERRDLEIERPGGLVRRLEDGRYEVISPTLLRAGRALVELGVEPRRALEIGATLRRHAAAIATSFVDVFARDVLGPPDPEAEADEERWARAAQAFERIRPLATETLLAAFRIEISDAIAAELRQRPTR